MTSFLTTGGMRGHNKNMLAKFYPRSHNMGVKKEIFDKVGGFGSLRHGQDIELSNRIINENAKVKLLENVIVYHRRRTTLMQFFRQVFNWGVARINLSIIDGKMLQIIHFLPSIATLLTILVLVGWIFYPAFFKPYIITGFLALCFICIYGGFKTKSFSSADDLIKSLDKSEPDLIITDVQMPGMLGYDLLKHINNNFEDLPVIVMTAFADMQAAVESFGGGAFEYIPKPFDLEDAIKIIERALEEKPKTKGLKKETKLDIIGESNAMQNVFRSIGKLSNTIATVLIQGESGTGKELIAKSLHKNSPRHDMPFIALNMADIPKELVESELFGHEKGSFTGAVDKRIGRFEQANGGTLFLDEIGDMPLDSQTRLLRVLSNREFYRVGGDKPIKVDVRIIAATHQNLNNLVSQKSFREDLFYRLNVIKIEVPPLRDRKEDISCLLYTSPSPRDKRQSRMPSSA